MDKAVAKPIRVRAGRLSIHPQSKVTLYSHCEVPCLIELLILRYLERSQPLHTHIHDSPSWNLSTLVLLHLSDIRPARMIVAGHTVGIVCQQNMHELRLYIPTFKFAFSSYVNVGAAVNTCSCGNLPSSILFTYIFNTIRSSLVEPSVYISSIDVFMSSMGDVNMPLVRLMSYGSTQAWSSVVAHDSARDGGTVPGR